MADEQSEDRQARAMRRAAMLVTEALDLLDGHGGAPEAAAHLDLALESLRRAIGEAEQ